MEMDYWLFLEPYVYISILEEEALLYNTLDGAILHFYDKDIINLIKELNPDLIVVVAYGKIYQKR